MEKIFKEVRELSELVKSLFILPKEYLSCQEAADYVGISLSTLYKHTSQHTIPFYRPNGKLIRFKKSELDDWMTKHRIV